MRSSGGSERKIGGITLVKYSGETEADVKRLSPDYFKGLGQGGAKKIALDMEDVTRFYSVSIGHLINVLKWVEGDGGSLFLINVPEVVVKALSSANVLPKFKVYPSEYDFVLDQGLEGSFGGGEGELSLPASEAFSITSTVQGPRVTVRLLGALIDAEGRKALWEAVRGALGPDVKEIVIDFEAAEFIDSIALGELVSLHRLCAEKGAVLRAVKVGEVVADAFRVTDLAKLFGLA